MHLVVKSKKQENGGWFFDLWAINVLGSSINDDSGQVHTQYMNRKSLAICES